ncbi:aminopeptidase P family N-terminal domain-containing protein, partial [Arthrospira platensis SPKY1]|nr:aminopeptidase P family N-terminal domain-containing protein [Arthrospira platensis SPKY1]
RWLSGFTGSAGYLLVTAEKALLATDFRYWEQAMAQSPDFTLVRHNRTAEADQEFLAAAGVQAIGLEADHLSLNEAARWGKAAENVAWVHLDATLEPLRWQKSAAELEAIRA